MLTLTDRPTPMFIYSRFEKTNQVHTPSYNINIKHKDANLQTLSNAASNAAKCSRKIDRNTVNNRRRSI